MKVTGAVYSVPKKGNSEDENEDAYWPTKVEGPIDLPLNFAIADGATETSYAGLWARLLVEGVCRDAADSETLESQVRGLREQWAKLIPRDNLPWYAEQKLEMGAFATLVGVALSVGTAGRAIADVFAIGDSCLFHIRSGQLITSFPATTHKELLARPLLISSKLDAPEAMEELVREATLECETEDVLLLATDAVSGWIFAQLESGLDPLPPLQDLFDGRRPYAEWICGLREQSAIKNDDCTMVWFVLQE